MNDNIDRTFYIHVIDRRGDTETLGAAGVAGWSIPQTADADSTLGRRLASREKPLESLVIIGLVEDRVYLLEKADFKKRDCCGREWFVLQWRRADAGRDEPKPTYIFNAGDEF